VLLDLVGIASEGDAHKISNSEGIIEVGGAKGVENSNPDFFFGWKAIALDCSSSVARPMRTAVARIAPLDPQLASCKREATEQTV